MHWCKLLCAGASPKELYGPMSCVYSPGLALADTSPVWDQFCQAASCECTALSKHLSACTLTPRKSHLIKDDVGRRVGSASAHVAACHCIDPVHKHKHLQEGMEQHAWLWHIFEVRLWSHDQNCVFDLKFGLEFGPQKSGQSHANHQPNRDQLVLCSP